MAKKKKSDLDQIKESYIQDLRLGQRYSIQKFDEEVLLISSGALVLSLNFIGEVVKMDQAIWKGLLYASWWLLASIMVVSVITHLISYNLHEKQIRRVENNEPLPDDKTTIRLNYFLAVALVLGIALQIIFVTKNLTQMADKKQNVNEVKRDSTNTSKSIITEKRSMPVASAPVQLKPGSGNLGAPVQSAPKDIKVQVDTPKSSGNKN